MRKLQIFIGITLTGFLLSSCLKPVEDRKDLNMNGVQIKPTFSVTQKTGIGNDNTVYLNSSMSNSLAFWDYVWGTSNKHVDTIAIPIAGDYYIKLTAYTKDGPVTDSAKVSVSKDNARFTSKKWALLTNKQAGKTWVWAYDNKQTPGKVRGIGGWAAGSVSPYAGDYFDWTAGFGWWTSGTDNQDGEITFDLNGGVHFIKKIAGIQSIGSFDMDTVANSIKVVGTPMINSEADSDGTYFIARLNDNELILCQVYSWGGQRPYYFKRKGYTF